MTEERVDYLSTTTAQWVFVRNKEGRATNVRALRGTTIIEVLHRGEKILFDTAEMMPLDQSVKSVYSK